MKKGKKRSNNGTNERIEKKEKGDVPLYIKRFDNYLINQYFMNT